MFQRLLALFAVAFLFAACETASNVTGDSASDSSSSSAAGSASASASASKSAKQAAIDLCIAENEIYEKAKLHGHAYSIIFGPCSFNLSRFCLVRGLWRTNSRKTISVPS